MSLGIKPNFSTAFHPQSDGQTERVNQTVETYLRTFVKSDQSNWSELLDLAKFAYNNSLHSSTKHTPFEANYGYHPLDPSSNPNPPHTSVPASDEHLRRLRSIHTQLLENLRSAASTQARYYNRKVLELTDKEGNPLFKVGDRVWLNGKNVRRLRPKVKLDQRMLGPFTIIGTTPSPLAFKLDLPPSLSALHPVFHVNLLEPVRQGHPHQPQDPPPEIIIDGQPEYIVDRILDSRFNEEDNEYQYLIHWRDFPDSENSWEPWDEIRKTTAYTHFRKHNRKTHHFPANSHHRTTPTRRQLRTRKLKGLRS